MILCSRNGNGLQIDFLLLRTVAHYWILGLNVRSYPSNKLLLQAASPFTRVGPVHLASIFHQDIGFERSCVTVAPQINPIDDEVKLSPLDWSTERRSLESPFLDDSDSDDGLAPSPFSSLHSGIK